jgi:parallel beta-helix repeat protein
VRSARGVLGLLLVFLSVAAPAGAQGVHRLIVSTDGRIDGRTDTFATVSDALASITPNVNNPYVIEVAAGVYTDTITMKSYVHLRGAGREVTTINALNGNAAVITLPNSPAPLTNVTISGLSLTGGTLGVDNRSGITLVIRDNLIGGNSSGGILTQSSSPLILNNHIETNRVYGIISIGATSAAMITGNTVTGNGSWGILDTGATTISGNSVTGNGTPSSGSGIRVSGNATIADNVITGNLFDGLTVFASPVIRGNRMTGNAKDLNVAAGGNPTATHNTLDSWIGPTTRWRYNADTNGNVIGQP